MKNIYQLALRCKRISDEKMGTDRNLIPYRNILFTDYTVKGDDEYGIAKRPVTWNTKNLRKNNIIRRVGGDFGGHWEVIDN